jgi:hypothetical protein
MAGVIDALTEKNLVVLGLGAEPRCDVAHRADRGVAGAVGKADLAQGREALRNASAKAQIATTLAPFGDQIASGFAHHHRHLYGTLGGVGTWHRIIEEHHDPVT